MTVPNHGDCIVVPHGAEGGGGGHGSGTMTQYSTELHYPDTELTSPCPILVMASVRLDSDKYTFFAWLFGEEE